MSPAEEQADGFRAVLWDLDGTIMDSQSGILISMRHCLVASGCEVPPDDELGKWVGPPLPESLRKWTNLDEAGVQRAHDLYKDHYAEHGAGLAQPFPEMVDLVKQLHASGVPLGLATSKPCMTALPQLTNIGLLEVFSSTGCADEKETRGSKIEVMSDAIDGLSSFGLETSQMLMIGDRVHDFEASRELGVTCVAVRWGYGNSDEWEHADHVVDSPEELRHFLETSVSHFPSS